jgi:hypothetical protein
VGSIHLSRRRFSGSRGRAGQPPCRLGDVLQRLDELSGEATEFIDAGENVFTVLHEKAGVGDSDVFVERDLFHVWTLRDGLLVKLRTFKTREEALEAAGLSG